MKNIFYLTTLALLISSSETTDHNTDSTNTDTVAMRPANIDIDVNALLAKFTIAAPMPFVQDTLYLEGLNLNDTNSLSSDEVKYLSYGFVETDVSYEGLSPVQDVLFFDSLQADGSYESYISAVDIGMMVRSDAFVAQKVIVDDSTSVLLWIVDYATYEACPYASGKILYGSVLRNGEVTSCTILGEDSGGADAPIWSTTLILVSITKTGITVFKTDENCGGEVDEKDQDIVDLSHLDFILTIDENGVWKQEPVGLGA